MKHLITILLSLLLIGASVEDARKANEAYEEGNYEEAISLYKKAIDENENNAKLYFNLASAQAKAGQPQEAIRTFEQYKTMVDGPEERAKADYNIGNVLAETEEWDKAAEYYKKSLRYMSGDSDAKHNYELAKKKKKEQQQNEQDQQDQQQNKQNEDNEQQENQDQQQQEQDQNQDNQQQNKNQQNNQNDQQEQNQNQQKQQQRPQEVSQAEAEKILEALGQKEKDLLKQFRKKKTESSNNKDEKDW